MVLTFFGVENGETVCDGELGTTQHNDDAESAAARARYAKLMMRKPDQTDKRNRDDATNQDTVGTTMRVSVEFGYHSVHHD